MKNTNLEIWKTLSYTVSSAPLLGNYKIILTAIQRKVAYTSSTLPAMKNDKNTNLRACKTKFLYKNSLPFWESKKKIQ